MTGGALRRLHPAPGSAVHRQPPTAVGVLAGAGACFSRAGRAKDAATRGPPRLRQPTGRPPAFPWRRSSTSGHPLQRRRLAMRRGGDCQGAGCRGSSTRDAGPKPDSRPTATSRRCCWRTWTQSQGQTPTRHDPGGKRGVDTGFKLGSPALCRGEALTKLARSAFKVACTCQICAATAVAHSEGAWLGVRETVCLIPLRDGMGPFATCDQAQAGQRTSWASRRHSAEA